MLWWVVVMTVWEPGRGDIWLGTWEAWVREGRIELQVNRRRQSKKVTRLHPKYGVKGQL